jgi:predicted lipoprotein with Yx(FWY)xxD motif
MTSRPAAARPNLTEIGVSILSRRILTLLLAGALLGAVILAPAAGARRVRRGTVIKLRHTKLGNLLVDGTGYTLYAFTPDTPHHDACEAIAQCLDLWPAVVTRAPVQAGRGIRRKLLGTVRLRDGERQVTYGGHPLYTYVRDSRPGETDNVNIFQFHGLWPAVDAAGREIDNHGHVMK